MEQIPQIRDELRCQIVLRRQEVPRPLRQAPHMNKVVILRRPDEI